MDLASGCCVEKRTKDGDHNSPPRVKCNVATYASTNLLHCTIFMFLVPTLSVDFFLTSLRSGTPSDFYNFSLSTLCRAGQLLKAQQKPGFVSSLRLNLTPALIKTED